MFPNGNSIHSITNYCIINYVLITPFFLYIFFFFHTQKFTDYNPQWYQIGYLNITEIN